MNETPTDELRLLAAKIATSYAQANAVLPEQLAGVIRLAYQGLQRCVAPPPAPVAAPVAKRRRGRPQST